MGTKSLAGNLEVKTVIHSNGSKWAGQEPDTIEQLIEVLGKHTLDIARFGAFGFCVFTESNGYSSRDYDKHSVRIHGNFLDVSHVFDIEGQYETLSQVIEAIEGNLKRIRDKAEATK